MDLSGARRIIIVDENDASHDELRRAFETVEPGVREEENSGVAGDRPHDVETAANGEEGYERIRAARAQSRSFAVAFVDMAPSSGWDVVTTISKMWEADADVQVVLLVSPSDPLVDLVLERLGASERLFLLKKPFAGSEIRQLTSALVAKRRQAGHARSELVELRGIAAERARHLDETARRLRESESRYALAAEGANDGLWDWDLTKNVVYFSPRWKSMLGWGDSEIGELPIEWFGRIHPDDRDLVERGFASPASAGNELSVEYRVQHKDGQYRWVHCRGVIVRDGVGRPQRAAGSQTDITDKKLAEAQRRHDAIHDPLTGLPNRVLLAERLGQNIVRQRWHPTFRFAAIFIDLDRFKVINDSLGHLVGDALLVHLSKRLLACVAEVDSMGYSEESVLVRIGGDEFVLLLEGIGDDDDLGLVADRLSQSVIEPIVIDDHTVHVSLSMGIAIGRGTYEAAEDVLRDADTALYRAKEEGRGRYRIFSQDLHASAMDRWQTENDLRRAIEGRELFLQYQPIVRLDTEVIEHFEALVRWRHPTRGLVPPLDFIPLAEETGLIVPLGHWVIDEACRQLAVWRTQLPAGFGDVSKLAVAVNVASKQLVRATFADEVAAILEARGVPASALKIEVTESSTMDRAAVEMCGRLRKLGVQLHLDDFGTGYSSLSYLNRMPLNALKIDRSFTSTMRDNAMNASIVQTVIALAKALGIEAIAEGVESAADLELLRRMGCSNGQGYYWSKPLDADRAFILLERSAARMNALASDVAPRPPLRRAS